MSHLVQSRKVIAGISGGALVALVLLVVLFLGMRSTPTPISQQPNVQATDVNIDQNIEKSPQHPILDAPRVSNFTFQFVTTQLGTYFFNFENSFSVSPTTVSLLVFLGYKTINETVSICPGCTYGVGDDAASSQVVLTKFNLTGGSPNEIHFSITVQTCSHTIGFSFMLVNSGNANGNATVNIQSGTTSYWQHSYVVAQGQHLPESGSSIVPDCTAHNYNLTVTGLEKT